MQYTSKFALLAAAIFGASALAIPLAPRSVDYEIEAREADTDLSAREFYDMYLEARADPSLDAREVDAMDLEAREYLEYLEAREAANNGATSSHTDTQSPSEPSKPVDESASKSSVSTPDEHPHHHKHQHKYERETRQEKTAKTVEKLRDSPATYKAALQDMKDPLHGAAVKLLFISDRSAFDKALADKGDINHNAAKRIAKHRKEAKKYLSSKAHYKKALAHKSNKYHDAAVHKYLSNLDNFERALSDKNSKYHEDAVIKQRREAHHKHGDELMTTKGAVPTKAADADTTHPPTATGEVSSSKVAARSY